MLTTFLRTSWRRLRRDGFYSAINIVGLAVGLSCFLVVLLYAQWQLSYDRFHANLDRIHKVIIRTNFNNTPEYHSLTSAPVGPALQRDFSPVRTFVRFRQFEATVEHNGVQFEEPTFLLADSSLFDVFSFGLLSGNPRTALVAPFSVVISEQLAHKYFQGRDPLNQALRVNGEHELLVTGVMKDVPENSHLRFDALVSFSTADVLQLNQHIGHFNYLTYVLLSEKSGGTEIERRSSEFIAKYFGEDVRDKFSVHLQPFRDVYLKSAEQFGIETGGSFRYLVVLFLIGSLILMTACINYINLSTALSTVRAREVGIRKVSGATRAELVRQFIGESLVLTVLSMVVAIVITIGLLPVLRDLFSIEVSLGALLRFRTLVELVVIVCLVGVLSGCYPAFVLSRFEPVEVLRSIHAAGSSRAVMRKALAIFQLSLSVLFIMASVVVARQIHYVAGAKLGFDSDNILFLRLRSGITLGQLEALKTLLTSSPLVEKCAASSGVPGLGNRSDPFAPEGFASGDYTTIPCLDVDQDFVATYGLTMVAGRSFSPEFPSDTDSGIVINEAAARRFGWSAPLGKRIQWLSGSQNTYTVIGVVKDFHFQSLHNAIMPLVMQIVPSNFFLLSIRYRSDDTASLLGHVRRHWEALFPDVPIEYHRVSELLSHQYRNEEQTLSTLTTLSLLAVFLCVLGLLGLTSFATASRTREIAVRKTFGALSSDIYLLLSREVTKLVLIAIAVAWPVSHYFMSRWLEEFAYRTEFGWITPLLCGLVVWLIALLASSYYTIKGAIVNPTDFLR